MCIYYVYNMCIYNTHVMYTYTHYTCLAIHVYIYSHINADSYYYS